MKQLLRLSSVLVCTLGAIVIAQESLGSVTIGRAVTADGRPLAAGTYQVRLTPETAEPHVAGETDRLERWVEFLQDGQVKGRELASVVPDTEIGEVAEGPRPGPNRSRVDLLKGDDYLRIWINRDGNNYLLHLPVGG